MKYAPYIIAAILLVWIVAAAFLPPNHCLAHREAVECR